MNFFILRFGAIVVSSLLACLGSFSLPAQAAGGDGAGFQDIHVSAFGAIPNDGKDDAEAFRRAAAACQDAEFPRLILEPGRYDFHRTRDPLVRGEPFLSFHGKSRFEVQGNGAVLMFADRMTPILFTDCHNVTVKGLTIDWEHPFYSQGKVLRVDGLSFDVLVDENYPVTGKEPIEGILDYDPETRWPISNIDVLASSALESVKLIAPQTLRITLKERKQPESRAHVEALMKELTGRLVVLRHLIYGDFALDFVTCAGVSVEDVNVYACPGMGIHSQLSRDISLKRTSVRIRPGSGRLMSTTADSQFFSHTTGFVKIEDGFIEGGGDDGLNVSGKYKTVTRIISEKTLEAEVPGGTWQGPTPKPGETIEIRRGSDMFLREQKQVEKAEWHADRRKFSITFATPFDLETAPGDLLFIETYIPSLTVTGTTFRGLRGRALLGSTRNILIENCRIEGNGIGGLSLIAGMRSHSQGPSTARLVVRNNRFIGCAGAAVFADASVPNPGMGVHRDVVIENNTFAELPALAAKRFKRWHPNWAYWNSAICLSSVEGVKIRGNEFKDFALDIYVDRSRNVEITGARSGSPVKAAYNKARVEGLRATGDNIEARAVEDGIYDPMPYFIQVLR